MTMIASQRAYRYAMQWRENQVDLTKLKIFQNDLTS